MIKARRHHLAAIVSAAAFVGALLAPTGIAAASSTSARTVPECTNSDLAASYHREDGGAGQLFGRIVLRNVSDHRCKTGGYGGLSYVAGNSGFQVGAAATRDSSIRVRTIFLNPGEKAKSELAESLATNYPSHKCRPHHVRGFRVYVPNETRAQYIPHPTTGCLNHKVHLLSHKAYTKV